MENVELEEKEEDVKIWGMLMKEKWVVKMVMIGMLLD